MKVTLKEQERTIEEMINSGKYTKIMDFLRWKLGKIRRMMLRNEIKS